jgi:hypothetical protein
MTSTPVSQSTDFSIKELSLVLSSGERFDISGIFSELNLFDNLFTPCVSGNILITDAQNVSEKLKFDGSGQNAKIKINIDKGVNKVEGLRYEKEFIIYSLTNRKNVNLSSQTYILNFVSEEFLLSEQKKISQTFSGLYSDVVSKILVDQLRVSRRDVKSNGGKGTLGIIYPTMMPQEFVIPNLTPFDTINWMSKRSVSQRYNNPDYVFFETQQTGYNFVPLEYLMSIKPIFNINFNPKNLDDDAKSEFLGARDMKVLSQFSLLENVRDGAYAGKFIGFDTLTRTVKVTNIRNVHENKKDSRGTQANLPGGLNKDNKNYTDMYDSRVVTYPFSLPRTTVQYIKDNNAPVSNVVDNAEDYVFQRKAIFSNLMQRRLQLTMPGNFGLFSGSTINLKVPRYGIKEDGRNNDKTLSGDYIIIGTRHIIRYDKHETLIEVATDKIEK